MRALFCAVATAFLLAAAAAGASQPETRTSQEPVLRPLDFDDDYPNRTQRLYLSGTDADDAVSWNFTVTAGRRAGEAATIPVPSNWELHGFGTFHYGTEPRTSEQGIYRRSFELPAAWAGRHIAIVFEGAMTDTFVTINGQSAGPPHQGAFYRFAYDVTTLVHPGASNRIEVVVSKESANASVNEAERQADYWAFGGIFRPVYLEATPEAAIARVALDARADGRLTIDVFLRGLEEDGEVTARVFDDLLIPVGPALSTYVRAGETQVRLTGTIPGIQPWSAEAPHRYRIAVELTGDRGTRHAVRESFGFRTVSVRPGDGLYVNGTKVRLRGLNRHCFWPDSGRALSRRLSIEDARLLKSMNANAVRNAHYPADKHFLDAADAIGLYVLDELAGWQSPPYDTTVGRALLEEMVTFDVNHPSILFWDNGNEGGWNPALDGEFARWDPQRRAVLHPWALFNGIDTDHYESYASTVAKLAGPNIYLPTEFLHGLYDGGGGAGLEDYWEATRASPRGAGGFLWAFADEGVRRDDQGGSIDVKGNAAPDGVLGPYREKEGSFYTIRQLWAPVRIAMERIGPNFDGNIEVENDYDFLDLHTVAFTWRLVTFEVRKPHPAQVLIAQGSARTKSIVPGDRGLLQLGLPPSWSEADALVLDATDAAGTHIGRWSWMIASAAQIRAKVVVAHQGVVTADRDATGNIRVSAGNASYVFGARSGQLVTVRAAGRPYSLRNGPRLSVGKAALKSITGAYEGNDYVLTATYTGDLQEVRWRVMPGGWLVLSYRYALSGSVDFHGIDFEYPETQVLGADWLGRGPHRVWKNRMKGPWHDVWSREKNDAVTGARWDYPEFKGYFADLHWLRLRTTEGPILFVADTDNLFLRLFTPGNGVSPQSTATAFPAGDISFLHGIAPIGDKFLAPAQTGPQGERHLLGGRPIEGQIYMRFGDD